MRFIFFLLVLSLLGYQTINAQTISNPCARLIIGLEQDSLSWAATPCSGFGGYVIFGSNNPNSGFVALDTLVTPAPTVFAHNNPNETVQYYQIGMLCGGSLVGLTTVISNQRPICPDILNVSIVGGVPVVSWSPSPSPEVIGYQLYKENPYNSGNFFPYPNSGFIINGLNYTDAGATDLLARYALVAISPCNESLLGEGNALDGTTGPHSSMIATGSLDTCNRKYTLRWNSYENWALGVLNYQIWVNTNNQGWLSVDTIAGTQFTYPNIQDEDVLQFQVRAAENGANNYALSNVLDLTAVVNRPMDFLRMVSANTTANDEVEIAWQWDTDTDFASAMLEQSTDKEEWTTALALNDLTTTTYTDVSLNPNNERVYYRVVSTDACGGVVTSNYASNFVLWGEAKPDFINKISWLAVDFQGATVLGYKIYKNVNGNAVWIADATPDQSVFYHQLDPLIESEALSCYYVVADLLLHFTGGSSVSTQSRSNMVCVQQNAIAHFPNALTPDGKNPVFKPVLVFGKSISQYQLQVFNRYGELIFTSNDFHIGWDGSYKGEKLGQGVYVYVARFTQPDGTLSEQRGSIFLLR